MPQPRVMRMWSYRYTAFGLTIGSELRCPELPPAAHERLPEVTIRLERLPDRLNGAREVAAGVEVGDQTFQLHVPDVARFRVTRGCEIVVDPLPQASLADVRLFLLGTVFGVLWYQRGTPPLHASAVRIDGRAVAFCGSSGAGKSTLAAALQHRGHPLLSDDTGIIAPDASGQPMYLAGVPRIRLWGDALDHLGISRAGLVRDGSRIDKYHLDAIGPHRQAPMEPLGLYFLEAAGPGDAVMVEPIESAEKIPRLMAHTYRSDLAPSLGGAEKRFLHCAWTAQNVPMRRFSRPWSLERLEQSLDVLEADIRLLSRQSRSAVLKRSSQ